jgi:hypothetical protein
MPIRVPEGQKSVQNTRSRYCTRAYFPYLSFGFFVETFKWPYRTCYMRLCFGGIRRRWHHGMWLIFHPRKRFTGKGTGKGSRSNRRSGGNGSGGAPYSPLDKSGSLPPGGVPAISMPGARRIKAGSSHERYLRGSHPEHAFLELTIKKSKSDDAAYTNGRVAYRPSSLSPLHLETLYDEEV